jgi:hypothetical protein
MIRFLRHASAPLRRLLSAVSRVLRDSGLRSGIFWWIIVSCTVTALSAVLTTEVAMEKADPSGHSSMDIVAWFLWILPWLLLPVGILVGFFLRPILLWIRGTRWLRAICRKYPMLINDPACMSSYFQQEVKGDFVALFTVIAILSLGLIALSVRAHGNITSSQFWHAVFENPGGAFAILTGMGTLVGSYLAVQAIIEMKHTITSYSQLTNRLAALIHEAGDSHEGVMFLSYCVIPGSWQVSAKMKNVLKVALNHERRRVEFVCLKYDDHLDLLKRIAPRGTAEKPIISTADIADFQEECESLINRLNTKGNREKGQAEGEPDAKNFNAEATRLSWSSMPGYYFFVSERRAILVAPIGLPMPDESVELARSAGFGRASVETLGFETTDRQIIQLLRHEFRKYKPRPNSEDSVLVTETGATK